MRPACASHSTRPPIPWLPLALLAVSIPAVCAAQSTLLGARLDFAAGHQPWAVATGDLNGDGRPDLVCVNTGASTISVLLGDGAGNFGPKTDYAVGSSPYAVAIADLNNDGRPDVLVVNYSGSPGTLSVFLGNGAGGFAPRVDVPGPNNATGIAVSDLNGDGKLDAAVSTIFSVAVYLGDGTGGFSAPTYNTAGPYTESLAVGDLDNDGKPDIVTANYQSSSVSVLRGNGDGTFAARADYPVGSAVDAVALGDLNNDGKLDVAVANFGTLSSSLGVLLGDGLGGLGTMSSYSLYYDSRPQSVAIADLNGDGKPDLAAALSNAASLALLMGDGTGNFGAASYYNTAGTPVAVAAADVNGDGQPDLAVAGNGADSVSVFLNCGNGGFGSAASFPTLSFPYDLAIGDLTGDGRPDVAVGYASGGTLVSTLLGNGAGVLGSHTDFTASTNPYSVALGDLNLDGKSDLVAVNHDASTVSVLLGNGTGSFGPKTDFAVGAGPYAAVIADFNGDGKPDVAVASTGSATVSVLLGTGTGSLGSATSFAVGTLPYSIALGDFNGDGRLDLATANYGTNNASVLLGNGSGGFLPKVDYTTMNGPISIAVGDLNSDGKQDLVVLTSLYPWGVSVLPGNGTGTFGTRTDFPNVNGAYPDEISVVDVNGDHHPDVLIAATYYSTADVLYGNGLGSLMGRTSVQCPPSVARLAVGDLDADGRPDLVTSNSGSLSVLLALKSTQTSLAVSPGNVLLGAALTLTANVTAVAPASGVPAGTVSFFDGFTLLGTTPVNGGVAALSLFAPRRGNRSITAVYNGDGKFQRSVSSLRMLRVAASAAPALAGIQDIKNDQGREVRVQFLASPYDYVGSPTSITQYEVYRQVNPALGLASRLAAPSRARPASVQMDGWDFVGSLAAHRESGYDLVVPTLADSNGSGIHRSSFFVRAATATPTLYFDSAPDSGYSVDNLAPAIPSPFTGAYSGGMSHLHWGANLEPDLWYYRLYRGSSAGFVPGPGNLIATPSDTGYTDAGVAGRFYKLSAVDVNGNESGFALLTPGGTTDVRGDESFGFALEGARPNPAHGPGLDIRFTLPGSEPARLDLIDVSGRRLASLDVGALGPGPHSIDLAEGRTVPAGLYLVRLTRAQRALDARVVVLP